MLNRVLLLSLCPALWRILLALKLVYIRGTQRHQFKMGSYLRSCLRDTRYALRTRNTYQLAGYVQCCSSDIVFNRNGFSFDSASFSLIVHCYFMAILKTSADTNAGQSHRLTHFIKKNLRCYNLKSLIFKPSLLFIHTFKNTTQLLKTIFCKLIAHKCYIFSFNLFHVF